MSRGTTENNKESNYNTSRSMGNYGAEVVTDATLTPPKGQAISAISVLSGTATVSGKQIAKGFDLQAVGLLADWSSVSLGTGVHIVPLRAVTVVVSGTSIVYYG